MYDLEDPSRKFISQLNKLFSDENLDFNFISERINAAFNYFLKPMDELVYEILWKLEEVKRIKKVKGFYEELLVLEEMQIKSVLRLLKAKKLIETVASGESISKENLMSSEIKNYKINKMERLREDFKKANITLIEDEADAQRYTSKKKEKSKELKKATTEETYELWLQKHSIQEIAALRKLTTQTIAGHIAKLIEAGKIQLTEVLPNDKIQELSQVFSGYTEASLIPLKDKYGDKFSWDELKMYKASLA